MNILDYIPEGHENAVTYFIPSQEETECLKRYIISEKSRARKIEKKIRSLEKYLANIGQEEMEFIG